MDRKINAAAFKAKCLALIDEVAESGQPLIVTKRGKPKVQIIAVREKPKTLIGATKGTFQILGDIVGPTMDDTDHEDRLERQARLINGQFNDPPARYAHHRVADGGPAKPRKGGKTRLQRRSRGT
jgi:prevent-host-death family protein